jgi:DNA-binding FrmR family transcriptional regulator
LTQKRTVVNRLKSIEGHIRDIERMVEKDLYCMDILAYNVAAIPIAAGDWFPSSARTISSTR